MIASYLNLVNVIRDTVGALDMVATFGYGPDVEVNATNDTQYPLVWLESQTTVNATRGAAFALAFQVLDRGKEGNEDMASILNKTLRIADNLLNALHLVDENLAPIDFVWNAVSLTNAYQDRVHGWRVEFAVQLPTGWQCELPTTDLDEVTYAG
jgi:hypothetical protein